ncbi:NHLP family bacteriocin export ABC transporter peptidase/permease/ATPase subunit [Lachnospiraceae bacterium C1.1]|nr:NHLP family bacteriocin export ABC transporter peptidase/permease/ATPase subunit [Lachnospiraceae bacterium C1.1]
MGRDGSRSKKKKVVKVPVVMQMEATECGAACLDMVFAYYGKWIPLEEMRVKCGVSRNGSNAKNLLLAARKENFTAKGYRFEPDELQEYGTFPCIVFWEFNHFVVVCGFKGNYVYINDPARGNIKISRESFDEGFTGVTLMFEPTEDFVPSGSKKSVLKFALSRLSGTKEAIAITAICSICASIFTIIFQAYARFFTDNLLTGLNTGYLLPFIISISVFSILNIILEWINAICSYRIEGKFATIGASAYIWKVLHLPMDFFNQRLAGDIQQRKNTNESIAGTLINTLSPLVLDSIMMLIYLVVMIRYNIILTLIGIISVCINIFVAAYISQKRVNITRVLMRDNGKLYSATVSGVEMIESIKASGSENGYFERWSGYQASVNNQNVKVLNISQTIGILPSLISTLSSSAILFIGVYMTMHGEFTVGMILAFQGFLSSFTAPVSNLLSAGQLIQEMRTSMERIEDVVEYKNDPVFENERSIDENNNYEKLSGNIEIKNLTFGYSILEEPLISDFNLTLKQGQSIAFVGATGCGKSTLSKLISGLYKPWGGEILFDGKNINEIDRNVFTGSVAVVDQNIILFEDTIANNIRMWDSSIEDFEVILAARDAQIHETIVSRRDGYDSMLKEDGSNLSGGERQRLEIARVLAQDPTIMIMDEATSALDADTEKSVVNAVRDRGITTIVIAHRLSTVRNCDEIIVLDKGKVIERGTHDELMSAGGKYCELVSSE